MEAKAVEREVVMHDAKDDVDGPDAAPSSHPPPPPPPSSRERAEQTIAKHTIEFPWPHGKRVVIKFQRWTKLFYVASWAELNACVEATNTLASALANAEPGASHVPDKCQWSEGPGVWSSAWFDTIDELRAHLYAAFTQTMPQGGMQELERCQEVLELMNQTRLSIDAVKDLLRAYPRHSELERVRIAGSISRVH